MSEGGDIDLFSGPAPSEQSEQSDEQFREEMKRTQQALVQLQQEEGQAKAHDDNLAAIIVQFLSQPQNTDLFLLISRVVAQNLPSELIIAILALIDKRANDEIKNLLAAGKEDEQKALAIREEASFKSLSQHHKKAIDNWIQNISVVAAKKPHRSLESVIIPGPKREISPVVIQLAAFVLRKFLEYHKITLEFENLRDFMQGVFVEIVKNLEELVKKQKQLN